MPSSVPLVLIGSLLVLLSQWPLNVEANDALATPVVGSVPMSFGVHKGTMFAGGLDTKLSLVVIDAKTVSASASGVGTIPVSHPLPKPRPRLLGPMYTETGKHAPVGPVLESPPIVEGNKFVAMLADRISAAWDSAVRKEATDWQSEVEVQFVFSVDAEEGGVTIESQSSPSGPVRLQRFRKVIEALEPVSLPQVLRAIYGIEVRFKFDFKATKAVLPAPGPDERR